MRSSLQTLLNKMTVLRDPKVGCHWDQVQTWETLTQYTLEEVYELIDSVHRADAQAVASELGDLLFHVLFYIQIAEEHQQFDFAAVVEQLEKKLVSRHPQVFSGAQLRVSEDPQKVWEQRKHAERKGGSILDDVPETLPALMRAQKLQKRAASVGFDWPDIQGVLDKIEEELQELMVEIRNPKSLIQVGDEIGDVLFTLVNFARHLGLDSEMLLMKSNEKFEKRFRHLEHAIGSEGLSISALPLSALEAYWEKAKETVDS